MSITTAYDEGGMDAVADSLLDTSGDDAEAERDDAVEIDSADYDVDADADTDDEPEEADEADDGTDDDADEPEEADEEPTDAPTTYAVKVDGREAQVTLDELRRGYSGQQYIQQQMESVASAKKEVEAIYHQLQTETQQVSQLRQRMEAGQMVPAPTPPDDAQFADDPIGYMEAKIAYDRQAREWQGQQAQLQAQQERQRQVQGQAQQAHLREQMSALQQAIPEFADPQTAGALRDRVIATGVNDYGYAPQELQQVTDARAVRVLHDAMRYRQLLAARKEAGAAKAPPTAGVRPGAKQRAPQGKAKRAQAASRMKRTGDVNDVATFLLS